MGAENPLTSGDLDILVYEAAEPVPAERSDGRAGTWGSVACGRPLMQRSVRTVRVVVLDIFVQHRGKVAGSGDQEMVEAFAAQCADEAFGDRVRSRRPNWCADDANVGAGEDHVEVDGELGGLFTDRVSLA